jgi:hypothetical protein
MNWKVYKWVWQLKAPMYIGAPPAGSLNRCRIYISARTLWGAVTAEMARSDNFYDFPDYDKAGKSIKFNCRFTYLYPAEKFGNNYELWLPKYEREKGLRWHCEKGNELSDSEFRHRLLTLRPGTAIDSETYSASEGSLRETECINPWWRGMSGSIGELAPVFMIGYVFTENMEIKKKLDNTDSLFVGGDTRYGLGKITRLGGLEDSESVFKKQVILNGNNPQIKSETAWGHVKYSGAAELFGSKELLGGWNMRKLQSGKLCWVPGSSADSSDCNWLIDECGYWKSV